MAVDSCPKAANDLLYLSALLNDLGSLIGCVAQDYFGLGDSGLNRESRLLPVRRETGKHLLSISDPTMLQGNDFARSRY
jgi:hypothetical protein